MCYICLVIYIYIVIYELLIWVIYSYICVIWLYIRVKCLWYLLICYIYMDMWLPGWWYTYPSENYESQLGLLFPPGKSFKIPWIQTTNQSYMITSYWVYTSQVIIAVRGARRTPCAPGAPGAPTSPLRPRRRHPRRRSPRWPLQQKHGRNWPMNLMVNG
jgi:hypothetical protein